MTKIGGISEMRRIIALAKEFGVRVVPHCPYFGPGFIASLHLAAALPADTPVERLSSIWKQARSATGSTSRTADCACRRRPGLAPIPIPALIARYRTHEPNIIK